MKKLSLILPLLSVLACGCSDDKPETRDQGKGSLSLASSLNLNLSETTGGTRTPVTDFSDYTLTLSGPEEREIEAPEALIEGLTPGDYTVTLSSYGEEYTPAFSDPRYEGETEVAVEAGNTAQANITLTQANAGLYFEYDTEALEAAGLGSVVPAATQNGVTLTYVEEEREAKGYFAPGSVRVAFSANGGEVAVEGEAFHDLTLSANDLVRVRLSASAPAAGATLDISVTFENATDKPAEVSVDVPDPTEIIGVSFAGAGADLVTGTVFRTATDIEIYIKDAATTAQIEALEFDFSTNNKYANITPAASNPAKVALAVPFKFTVTAPTRAGIGTEYTVTLWKRQTWGFEAWELKNTNTDEGKRYMGDANNVWGNSNAGMTALMALDFMTKYKGGFPVNPTPHNFGDRRGNHTEPAHGGAKAAKLQSIYTDLSLAPGLISASLFTGAFETVFTDALQSTRFGIDFAHKPHTVRGWYRYTPGTTFYDEKKTATGNDQCAITAVLFESDPTAEKNWLNGHSMLYLDMPDKTTREKAINIDKIVAMGALSSGATAGTDYVEFTVDLDYNYGPSVNGISYNPSKEYRFAIIFSASKEGAIFRGAHESTMIVDDVEVLCE